MAATKRARIGGIFWTYTQRINTLSTTTNDLLHFMHQYGKLHNIKGQVTVHLVGDQLQRNDTDTCGMFQLYFYMNLFIPVDGSSIILDKTLSKSTIEKLMNGIFSLDRGNNEKLVEQFAEESEIRKKTA